MNTLQKEHLHQSLDLKIQAKLKDFDRTNPKATALEDWELVKIAANDPAWRSKIVEQSRRGNSWDCRSQIIRDSPKAAAAEKKNATANKSVVAKRAAFERSLYDRRNAIVDEAIIGDIPAIEVLKMVRAF